MTIDSTTLITNALGRLSILEINGTPTSDQLAAATVIYNDLLTSWNLDGIYLDPLQPLPDKYGPAITAMLAMELAPSYGEGAIVSPQLAADAKNGMTGLLAAFVYAPQANFDSALRNLPSQRLLGQIGTPFSVGNVLPSSAPSTSGLCVLSPMNPTTTVPVIGCTSSSTVTISPYSRGAQQEWDTNIRPSAVCGSGSFVITHANNLVDDRVFEYLLTY